MLTVHAVLSLSDSRWCRSNQRVWKKKKKEKRKGGWGAMAPRIRGLSHHLP